MKNQPPPPLRNVVCDKDYGEDRRKSGLGEQNRKEIRIRRVFEGGEVSGVPHTQDPVGAVGVVVLKLSE